MRTSIISLLIWCGVAGSAVAASSGDLAADAPERYIVVPGDTLWSISARYLKDPWRWPELWKNNEDQIKNPHRIHPGDVLVLDRSAQEMRLKLLQSQPVLETVKLSPQVVATEHEPEPVPTIPAAAIAPFLSQPLVVAQNEFGSAARIVATQEDRVALGAGNIAYAAGITKEKGIDWRIFRRGDPLVDPDTKETLGYQVNYLGDARVTKFGDVSTIEIVKSDLEISADDTLLPAARDDVISDYLPHAPAAKVAGRIIDIYGDLGETGPNSIVVLNKGARDGLDPGSVLAIYRDLNSPTYQTRESPHIKYHYEPMGDRNSPIFGRTGPTGGDSGADKHQGVRKARLPDERYGLLMVFRTFDRVSYALVMNSSRPVTQFDTVTNP
ncbi:MAG TPA: LysM peptidoglycan-binding domain-containing protein [Burkholderiales bacterium]|nr:LysM peptidoglycan-binding domain-containing protein [Burkholderiales bacterium]